MVLMLLRVVPPTQPKQDNSSSEDKHDEKTADSTPKAETVEK